MAVDPIAASSISNAADAAAEASKRDDGLGRDVFLQLLVTKLRNQDPTNPASDTEFLAQLAQFSSLEELTSINKAVTALADRMAEIDTPQAPANTTPPTERLA